MSKYRIEIDLAKCIGAFACSDVYPELWEVGSDGKTHILLDGKVEEDGIEYIEINDKKFDVVQAIQSQDICPVQAIKVTKIE
mgnify:CR=1 FL=1